MNKNKLILLSIPTVIFIFIFFYGLILSLNVSCNHVSSKITIPKGASLNEVANILEYNLCLDSFIFKTAMFMTYNEKNIKYGRYDLKSVNNVSDLITLITSVSKDRVRITIFEGLKIQEIALIFKDKMDVDIEKFLELCYDKKFIKELGLESKIPKLEGYLYPDTYIFLKSFTESDIIEVMVRQFIYNYDKYVKNKTNLNMHQLVTLASIIQGEAVYDDEMKIISSVYHNRLDKDMLLQADPTVQYLFPKQKKKILIKDTEIKSPYNTYLNKGLPPGPINNPGIEAIVAAGDPAKTDYFYFVSDKKGRHIFNKTYKAHLKSK